MAVPGRGLFHDSEGPRRVLLTTVPVWFLIPPELFLCMQLLLPNKNKKKSVTADVICPNISTKFAC